MRYLWTFLLLPLMILILGFTLVALVPVGSAHAAPARDVASTLPMCTYEDGSGQALCMWDASELGNGMGTDVIAGDCSIGTVGDARTSNACLAVWASDNGPVLVDECLTIEWEASNDKAYRESLVKDGWNLEECFSVFIP